VGNQVLVVAPKTTAREVHKNRIGMVMSTPEAGKNLYSVKFADKSLVSFFAKEIELAPTPSALSNSFYKELIVNYSPTAVQAQWEASAKADRAAAVYVAPRGANDAQSPEIVVGVSVKVLAAARKYAQHIGSIGVVLERNSSGYLTVEFSPDVTAKFRVTEGVELVTPSSRAAGSTASSSTADDPGPAAGSKKKKRRKGEHVGTSASTAAFSSTADADPGPAAGSKKKKRRKRKGERVSTSASTLVERKPEPFLDSIFDVGGAGAWDGVLWA